jgi:hypothetical protein
MNAKTIWNETEAPKDRPIVAIGKVMVEDDFSTAAYPFCHAIEWRIDGGHADWYYYHIDGQPMTVRRALDEKIIIHCWVDYPVRSEQPIKE